MQIGTNLGRVQHGLEPNTDQLIRTWANPNMDQLFHIWHLNRCRPNVDPHLAPKWVESKCSSKVGSHFAVVAEIFTQL